MKTKLFDIIPALKLSALRQFHNLTKIISFAASKDLPYKKWPAEWTQIYYKGYPRLKQIILPDPSKINTKLTDSILIRQSIRDYSNKPISKQKLSDLLFYSAGLKRLVTHGKTGKRFYPSAGGRYPLEVYLAVLNVNGIKPGIYHYHLKTHSLELILPQPFKQELFKQLNQAWIEKSGLIILITALFGRSENKYGNRSYRHIFTEYGHLAQNIYLLSTALKLGCCSIGGFIDDGLNKILDIDGYEEGVIGVVVMGEPE